MHGDDEANRQKLLKNMSGKSDRSAYFQCVTVEYFPDDTYKLGDGRTYGQIIKEKVGDETFGFDCLFYSDDLKKTFGEATAEEKNKVSHRYRAITALIGEKDRIKE